MLSHKNRGTITKNMICERFLTYIGAVNYFFSREMSLLALMRVKNEGFDCFFTKADCLNLGTF